MIFGLYFIVHYLSQFLVLEPADPMRRGTRGLGTRRQTAVGTR